MKERNVPGGHLTKVCKGRILHIKANEIYETKRVEKSVSIFKYFLGFSMKNSTFTDFRCISICIDTRFLKNLSLLGNTNGAKRFSS